jgi:hypothetical protein
MPIRHDSFPGEPYLIVRRTSISEFQSQVIPEHQREVTFAGHYNRVGQYPLVFRVRATAKIGDVARKLCKAARQPWGGDHHYAVKWLGDDEQLVEV